MKIKEEYTEEEYQKDMEFLANESKEDFMKRHKIKTKNRGQEMNVRIW